MNCMHKEHVRHIPVLEENRFIGLISDRTLANYTLRQLYDFDENTESAADNKISEFEELMERNVRVVYPEDSVRKAIEIMAKTKADCLPVVDWKNNLIGILTSTDVLLFLHKKLGEI